MESAAYLVVDSAFRHLRERQACEVQCVFVACRFRVRQQEFVQRWLWKLRLDASAAADVIEVC